MELADWTAPTIDSWRHSIWVGVWDPWIVVFKVRTQGCVHGVEEARRVDGRQLAGAWWSSRSAVSAWAWMCESWRQAPHGAQQLLVQGRT